MPKNPEKFEPKFENEPEGGEHEEESKIEELKGVEEEGSKKSEQELTETREELEKISERREEEKLEEREADEGKRNLEITKEIVGETLPKVFEDLVGDDSKKAWGRRKTWEGKEPMYVAASLAGVASEKSREWLDKHKEDQKLWWGISRGLIGDNSEEAWEIRDWLKFDQKAKRVRGKRWTSLKKSLGLHKSERLFNLRSRIKFPGWYEPGDIAISTAGLDSEKAQQLREEFEDIAPAEVLMSLAGNNSEGAQKIRKKYENDKRLRWAYEKSLTGVEI